MFLYQLDNALFDNVNIPRMEDSHEGSVSSRRICFETGISSISYSKYSKHSLLIKFTISSYKADSKIVVKYVRPRFVPV